MTVTPVSGDLIAPHRGHQDAYRDLHHAMGFGIGWNAPRHVPRHGILEFPLAWKNTYTPYFAKQMMRNLCMAVRTFKLRNGLAIIIQSQPLHTAQNGIGCFGVERSRSVSSIRKRNFPPRPRAYSQLNSAVRAVPMCI